MIYIHNFLVSVRLHAPAAKHPEHRRPEKRRRLAVAQNARLVPAVARSAAKRESVAGQNANVSTVEPSHRQAFAGRRPESAGHRLREGRLPEHSAGLVESVQTGAGAQCVEGRLFGGQTESTVAQVGQRRSNAIGDRLRNVSCGVDDVIAAQARHIIGSVFLNKFIVYFCLIVCRELKTKWMNY